LIVFTLKQNDASHFHPDAPSADRMKWCRRSGCRHLRLCLLLLITMLLRLAFSWRMKR